MPWTAPWPFHSDNPISVVAGQMLMKFVNANTRIVDLVLDGTLLMKTQVSPAPQSPTPLHPRPAVARRGGALHVPQG